MKERILFECVGQCGGNIGQLFSKKGYICHFTNTSNDDLNSITTVSDRLKYHVPTASGCNKNRKKAMSYAKDYYEHITNVIDNKFPRQDIVFFVFSLGGGTGSGMSPILLDYMIKKNPNKRYGAIVILPSIDDTIVAQRNALECYKQLGKIDNLNVFVIDNDNGDKTQLNRRFVEVFDRMINITESHRDGIIDKAELELLLTTSGMSYMGFFDSPNSLKHKIKFEPNIFAPFKKGCKYIGLSIADKVNKEIIEKTFGKPKDMFVGYNQDKNFIVATGLSLYTDSIEILAESIKDKQYDRINPPIDDLDSIEIPDIEEYPPKIKKKDTKLDFDDIFNKFME